MKIRVARALIQVALWPLIFAACNDSTGPDRLAWLIVPSGTVKELDGVWGTSASNVWAVGDETILHYDGATWSTVVGGSGSALSGIWLLGIWGSSASNIWAVGFQAGGPPVILHYDGASWSSVPSPSPTETGYTSVSGSSASDVWVAGDGGFISHYDGTSWSIVPIGTRQPLTAVWASSPSDVWVVGYEGMFHYDGASWAPVTGMSGEFWGLSGTSQSDVWAVGHVGPSHYDGTSWSGGPQESALPEFAIGVWASSRTDAWTVGVNLASAGYVSKIAYYNGTTWSGVSMGKSSAFLAAVWGSSATDVWVVGDGGTILHGTR